MKITKYLNIYKSKDPYNPAATKTYAHDTLQGALDSAAQYMNPIVIGAIVEYTVQKIEVGEYYKRKDSQFIVKYTVIEVLDEHVVVRTGNGFNLTSHVISLSLFTDTYEKVLI